MYRLLIALVVVSQFLGCCALNGDNQFGGDGELRAIACWPFENYVLDLGILDLESEGERNLNFSGLPKMEWVVGFAIPRSEEAPTCARMKDERWTDAVVELELSKVGGELVFHQRAPLRDWTWKSYGGLGEPECEVSSDSYFKPKYPEEYRLVARVSGPVSGAPATRLKIRTFAVYLPETCTAA